LERLASRSTMHPPVGVSRIAVGVDGFPEGNDAVVPAR
jgi:hypothetical protein